MSGSNVVSQIGTALWRRRNPKWATMPAGQLAPRLELSVRTLPRYLADRGTLAVASRRPGARDRPWLTAQSLSLLEARLRPTDRALEFGSGSSTAWLAARVRSLHSVEASQSWHREVSSRLARAGLDNVRLEWAAGSDERDRPELRERYVNAHPDLEPGSLDLVLVDGEFRDSCALRAVSLLRSGGVLVLDNANTYLPGTSRSPWRVTEPATALWRDFLDEVDGWRAVWTTNGVWDTALWFKP